MIIDLAQVKHADRYYYWIPMQDTSIGSTFASVELPAAKAGYVAAVTFYVGGYPNPGIVRVARWAGARTSGGTQMTAIPQVSSNNKTPACKMYSWSSAHGSNGTAIVASGSRAEDYATGFVYYSNLVLPTDRPIVLQPGEIVAALPALNVNLFTGMVVVDEFEMSGGDAASAAVPRLA